MPSYSSNQTLHCLSGKKICTCVVSYLWLSKHWPQKATSTKPPFPPTFYSLGAQWFATANFILRQIPKTVKSLQVLLACPLGIQTIMNFFSPTKYFFENKNTSTIDWIVTPTDLKIRQHQKRAHEEFFTPWRSSNPRREAAFYWQTVGQTSVLHGG